MIGAILGAVAGTVLVLLVLAGGGYLLWRRQESERYNRQYDALYLESEAKALAGTVALTAALQAHSAANLSSADGLKAIPGLVQGLVSLCQTQVGATVSLRAAVKNFTDTFSGRNAPEDAGYQVATEQDSDIMFLRKLKEQQGMDPNQALVEAQIEVEKKAQGEFAQVDLG